MFPIKLQTEKTVSNSYSSVDISVIIPFDHGNIFWKDLIVASKS